MTILDRLILIFVSIMAIGAGSVALMLAFTIIRHVWRGKP